MFLFLARFNLALTYNDGLFPKKWIVDEFIGDHRIEDFGSVKKTNPHWRWKNQLQRRKNGDDWREFVRCRGNGLERKKSGVGSFWRGWLRQCSIPQNCAQIGQIFGLEGKNWIWRKWRQKCLSGYVCLGCQIKIFGHFHPLNSTIGDDWVHALVFWPIYPRGISHSEKAICHWKAQRVP